MSGHYYLLTEEQHFEMERAYHLLELIGKLADGTANAGLAALSDLACAQLKPLLTAPCRLVTLEAATVTAISTATGHQQAR